MSTILGKEPIQLMRFIQTPQNDQVGFERNKIRTFSPLVNTHRYKNLYPHKYRHTQKHIQYGTPHTPPKKKKKIKR